MSRCHPLTERPADPDPGIFRSPSALPPQLRVTVLAMTFLACRFLVKLAILPTLMLMFTLRWFVMNPLPKKTKKPNAGGEAAAAADAESDAKRNSGKGDSS